jgi:hypothetical protein
MGKPHFLDVAILSLMPIRLKDMPIILDILYSSCAPSYPLSWSAVTIHRSTMLPYTKSIPISAISGHPSLSRARSQRAFNFRLSPETALPARARPGDGSE